VRVPDYISPIIGYRVWKWDGTGLKSLNGEPWLPQRRLAATCRARNSHDTHEPPQTDCTCGIYAAKTFHHLCSTGYDRYGVQGEVNLWGTVVEHELGYRAQFAYPKTLLLSPGALTPALVEIQSRLKMLTTYRIDIFVADPKGNIPLWGMDVGYSPAGLDYLIERSTQYHDRRRQERRIKRGDRVAILGRGIAVVEQADGKWIQAVLCNKSSLRIARVCVLWDGHNVRWETSPHACVETNAKACGC